MLNRKRPLLKWYNRKCYRRYIQCDIVTWAKQFGRVRVVTGPIVGDNVHGTIGKNRVVIPDAFFKAVLAGDQTIAFVMYNQAENAPIEDCAMSIDDLEELLEIDIFADLKGCKGKRIESSYSRSFWDL